MITQQKLFEKAKEENKKSLNSLNGVFSEEEQQKLMEMANCYNKTIELIKTLSMTNQQEKIFFDKAKENIYTESRLQQMAFAVCSLYKSEYQIAENANEKLNLLCDPESSEIRASQVWIGISKNLTLDEIQECLSVNDEKIVEKTKEIFCKHYNKEYNPHKSILIQEEER